MSAKKGFTLIEIIVVMVIIGILAAIAIPNYLTFMQQGAAKAAQNNLVTIYNAQRNYYLNNGNYCIAGCDNITDINLAANLNLNINDTNFSYACVAVAGPSYTCTATNNSDNTFTLTVSSGTPSNPNPIVLPGGTPPLNPSCQYLANPSFCPN